MKVDVYRNLRTGGFSIRHKGTVVAHADRVCVRNARFIVQPGGAARAAQTGQRNVHAFVRGELVASPREGWSVVGEATYRPFEGPASFVDAVTGEVLDGWPLVTCEGSRVKLH